MSKVTIICFGFSEKNNRSQPWHMADGLGKSLCQSGHSVELITDVNDFPVREYNIKYVSKIFSSFKPSDDLVSAVESFGPRSVFVFIGSHELLFPTKFVFHRNVVLVICNARFNIKEISRISLTGYFDEFSLLFKPVLGSFIPGALLKRGFLKSQAKDIVFVSKAAQTRYSQLGLPMGHVFLPSVDDCYFKNASSFISTTKTICYFGPPLRLRGINLTIRSFEKVAKFDKDVRLKLLLRVKGEPYMKRKLEEILLSAKKSEFSDRIDVVSKYLSPHELKAELDTIAVFLLPFQITVSDSPLVVIEAGLTGKPVVALDTPGVEEYVTALGGVCVKNPNDLDQGILTALTNIENNGSISIKKWLTWEESSKSIVEKLKAYE